MSHKRTLIRNSLVMMLKNNTAAEGRVEANRTTDIKDTPSIVIYDAKEEATPRDVSGKQYIRNLEMKIELTVIGTTTIDADLDNLSKEVEDLISADRSIMGTAIKCIYNDMEKSVEQAEQRIGKATLTYLITYIS